MLSNPLIFFSSFDKNQALVAEWNGLGIRDVLSDDVERELSVAFRKQLEIYENLTMVPLLPTSKRLAFQVCRSPSMGLG